MIKKLSFWLVIVVVALIGSMAFIHWKALVDLRQRTSVIQPLYQRQKVLDSLTLNLERYRRLSTSFRKLAPSEIAETKSRLRQTFEDGVAQLDKLNSTSEEKTQSHRLEGQIDELLTTSARIEPTLFSQDAYVKAEVQEIHENILKTLSTLEKSTQSHIASLHFNSSRSETESLILLLAVGGGVFLLVLCLLLRNYLVQTRPLNRLYQYAKEIKPGVAVPPPSPQLTGPYSEIQTILHQLGTGIETYMKDRHKFIVDIVSDLKSPLLLLQEGRHLLGMTGQQMDEEQQISAAEAVRRGLAIFSGSLDDLNDLADINRLESRLEETTVDLSDLLSDVTRTLIGSDPGKRISLTVPPMPVWVYVDAPRLQRVFVQVLSKVLSTLPKGGNLALAIQSVNQGNFRGVEVVVQDADRLKTGRTVGTGPEQDILKHWVSEMGLSMTLAHKVIKAHGGTITAAGVAGTSVTMAVRFPQERVRSRGLIAPPAEEISPGIRSLVMPKTTLGQEGVLT